MAHRFALVDSDDVIVSATVWNPNVVLGPNFHRLLDIAAYCGLGDSPMLPKREKETVNKLEKKIKNKKNKNKK